MSSGDARVDYRIRPATEADAEAICRIYNQGIEDRLATLETELRTPDERRQWLAARGPRHPVIVAETAAPAPSPGPRSTSFNARDAYRFVADISVYVERQWRGKGAGRVLLARLIELGREHGFHKLVLSAFPFNAGRDGALRRAWASARSGCTRNRASSTATGSTPSSWRDCYEDPLHAEHDLPRHPRRRPEADPRAGRPRLRADRGARRRDPAQGDRRHRRGVRPRAQRRLRRRPPAEATTTRSAPAWTRSSPPSWWPAT